MVRKLALVSSIAMTALSSAQANCARPSGALQPKKALAAPRELRACRMGKQIRIRHPISPPMNTGGQSPRNVRPRSLRSPATGRAVQASSTTNSIRATGLEPPALCEGAGDRQARVPVESARPADCHGVPELRIIDQELWDRVTVLENLKSRLMDPALFRVFAQEFVAEANRLRGREAHPPYRRRNRRRLPGRSLSFPEQSACL
jgi:hypothetical protein